MPNLKPVEILLILLVVLLLFGAKRLPDLARSVGKSMKILKTEAKDLHDDDQPPATGPANPSADASVPPLTTPAAGYRNPLNHPQGADETERKQV